MDNNAVETVEDALKKAVAGLAEMRETAKSVVTTKQPTNYQKPVSIDQSRKMVLTS